MTVTDGLWSRWSQRRTSGDWGTWVWLEERVKGGRAWLGGTTTTSIENKLHIAMRCGIELVVGQGDALDFDVAVPGDGKTSFKAL